MHISFINYRSVISLRSINPWPGIDDSPGSVALILIAVVQGFVSSYCECWCCCCLASVCLADQALSPLRVINCFVLWGTKAIPRVHCSRPLGSEQKERWARLSVHGYIHLGDALPIDAPRRVLLAVVEDIGSGGEFWQGCWVLAVVVV